MLVADDQPIARAGIATAVRKQPDLELVAEADDGGHALELIRDLGPDVAVVDTSMPVLDGLSVLASVTNERLDTRVLLIATAGDRGTVREAMGAGATGYLTKNDALREVCETIRKAARGERHLSPEAQAMLLEELESQRVQAKPVLTERERTILQLMAEGHSSVSIARRLYLSQSTVKNHQQHLYTKLGVPNAVAAIYQASLQGLLS